MSLNTPDTIRTLQRKLYAKAKQDTAYRCCALYHKISSEVSSITPGVFPSPGVPALMGSASKP